MINSVVLFEAPIWKRVIKYGRTRMKLRALQRAVALRVCSAYRTASTEGVFVLAGLPPLELLIWVRTQRYGERDQVQICEELFERWQET